MSSLGSLSKRSIKSQRLYKQTHHRVISQGTPKSIDQAYQDNEKTSKAVWPDVNMPTQLERPDFRVSLPGDVGLIDAQQQFGNKSKQFENPEKIVQFIINQAIEKRRTKQSNEIDLMGDNQSPEKAVKSLQDAIRFSDREFTHPDVKQSVWDKDQTYKDVECFVREQSHEVMVHSVPELLKTQLEETFRPYFDGSNRKINTVITVAFQTENDMSAWSDEVADERAVKLQEFTEFAKKFSSIVQEKDKFADFIDPSDGLPWFDKAFAERRGMVAETTPGFNALSNMTVEDLGCCYVISHEKFGKNVFVGTIVTECDPDFWYFGYLKYMKDQKIE